MSIGTRIQIQLIQYVQGRGANGKNTEVQGDKFGVWAEIDNGSGGRDYANGIVQFNNTKRFLVRFRFDKFIDSTWKIKYEGKNWTISQIEKIDEKRFYWRVTASAKNEV